MKLKMKVKQRFCLAVVMLVMLSSLLVACSPESMNSPSSKGGANKPTEISIMLNTRAKQFPDSSNVIWKEFEQRTNTKLNIMFNTGSSYDEKLNVTLASGNLPDVILVESMQPQVRRMVEQGAFRDLTDKLKEYPSLLNIPAESWKDSKLFGKNYVIPRYLPNVGGGSFPMIRKDWLDKFHLEIPTTLEDYYQALKTFKNDPDGNGKDDTFPLIIDAQRIKWVFYAFNNSQGDWRLKDGKVAFSWFEPESRSAIQYLKKLYAEGLLHPEFSIISNSQVFNLMFSGKGGATNLSMTQTWPITREIQKTVPEGNMYALPFIEGPLGKYVWSDPSYYGQFLIPKSVSEEKLSKIMEFFEYGYSKEGQELAQFGLKDVHFTLENGEKKVTSKWETDLVAENWIYLFASTDKAANVKTPDMPKSYVDRNMKILDQRAAVANTPIFNLFSDMESKIGSDLRQRINDTWIRVVMGVDPIEAWDKLVNEWKNDTRFQTMMKEINEAYLKNK